MSPQDQTVMVIIVMMTEENKSLGFDSYLLWSWL